MNNKYILKLIMDLGLELTKKNHKWSNDLRNRFEITIKNLTTF